MEEAAPGHESALSGYAIGTGMLHSAYAAHAELKNPHAVAQVSFCLEHPNVKGETVF